MAKHRKTDGPIDRSTDRPAEHTAMHIRAHSSHVFVISTPPFNCNLRFSIRPAQWFANCLSLQLCAAAHTTLTITKCACYVRTMYVHMTNWAQSTKYIDAQALLFKAIRGVWLFYFANQPNQTKSTKNKKYIWRVRFIYSFVVFFVSSSLLRCCCLLIFISIQNSIQVDCIESWCTFAVYMCVVAGGIVRSIQLRYFDK